MSIEFARSYKTSDGKCHGTLEEAQSHQLRIILGDKEAIIQQIIEQSDWIVDVLTMKETSRPKARGAKKPRKNRVTEPVQTTSA